MQELINVNLNENQEPVVSGRQLHKVLGVKTAYKDWFKRMTEYGFTKCEDFNPLKFEQVRKEGKRVVKREITDHVLKLDMAKEVAMIQRTDKGKEVRKYFIQVEKDFNNPQKVMARALVIAQKELDTLRIELEEQKPLVNFANAVSTSEDSILVGDFAKLMSQNGVKIGQNRLFEWLRQKGFLISRKGDSWNMPTQKAMDRGLFEVEESTVKSASGLVKLYRTTKITGKGQLYFSDIILNDDTLWVK